MHLCNVKALMSMIFIVVSSSKVLLLLRTSGGCVWCYIPVGCYNLIVSVVFCLVKLQ